MSHPVESSSPTARGGEQASAASVVSALVRSGLVDPERADEARSVVGTALTGDRPAEVPLRRRLAEVAGYVGGALVVAAAVIFLTEEWANLSTAGRVGTLTGIAVVLYAAAVAVRLLGRRHEGQPQEAGPGEGIRRRLASALASGGAVAVAFAVGLLVQEVSAPASTAPMAAGGLALLLAALGGYVLAPSALGQVAMVTGAVTAVGSGLDVFLTMASDVPFALAMMAVGLCWALLAELGLLAERTAGVSFGCVLLLFGAQYPVLGSDEEWVGYVLTAVVAVAGVLTYVRRRAVPYLVTAVLGITLVVPETLLEWSDGSLGPVGVLLAAGVTLLAASLLGLRLRQEIAGEPRTPQAPA